MNKIQLCVNMNSYFECRRCGGKTGALEWVEVKLHDSSLKGRNLVFNTHTILFLNDSDSVAFPIAAFLLKIFCATFFAKRYSNFVIFDIPQITNLH